MQSNPRFYCGLSHKYWSYHLCNPGSYGCVSPVVSSGQHIMRSNNVYVPEGTTVLQDSGAYGESSNLFFRLSFEEALKRQERHAAKYDYADKIAYRASYDFLIDHRFAATAGSSRRQIQRLPENYGDVAVEKSVEAAHFLDAHRNGYHLALNVQGVTPQQYLSCVQQVVPLLRDGDTLGLGGWCILGRLPQMMSDFLETLSAIMPFLAHEHIPRVHLYGCLYTPALAAMLAICDYYQIALSIDSAFPSFGPRIGKWGYGSWHTERYRRPDVLPSCQHESCLPGTRCAGLECIRHIQLTRDWLSNFRQREKVFYNKYARNLDQYQYGQIVDI